jgi:glucoamylase
VRCGLRAADDPRIVDTIKVIDATLKRETKTGPVWVRSSKDGYGEHSDGSPFDKTGIGRGWPLLAGERAHYEIAAGNREYALELLRTIARQTSEAGMIPEQVWDAKDIPDRSLFNGHPSGSGMPLVWAHSEYIKLLRSLHSGNIWDMPAQTAERYLRQKKTADFQIWTPAQRRTWLTREKNLRVDLNAPASITWDTAAGTHSMTTSDSGFNLHTGILPLSHLPAGSSVHVNITSRDAAGERKRDSFTIRVRDG